MTKHEIYKKLYQLAYEIGLDEPFGYKPKIISGFPGIGKTYFTEHNLLSESSDSDSSKFPKDNFPQNYIEHIKNLRKTTSIILVSSHGAVREALVSEGLKFVLCYPNKELKAEYLERYKQRGSNQSFINMMDKNWDSFIDQCKNQKNCHHLVLNAGEFLDMPRVVMLPGGWG